MKPTLYAVSVLGGGVYVGGTTNNARGNAFLAEYGQSSSLILFGVNPPFSFGLAALLAGVAVTAVWWLRRHYSNKPRSYAAEKALLKSKRIPSDALPRFAIVKSLGERRTCPCRIRYGRLTA